MSYRIEKNSIVFTTPPDVGDEIEIFVTDKINSKGFKDPNSFYPRRVNEVDTNRLAVNNKQNQHPVIFHKRDTLDTVIDEPVTPYNAKYPHNHVYESESGHIREYDDTPGYERIHEYHRSGTFYEVHPDGSKVTKIVGNDYEVVHKDKKLHVRGNIVVHIDGNANLEVIGDLNADVHNNMKLKVKENLDVHVGKNFRLFANKSIEMTSQTTTSITSVDDMQLQTKQDMDLISEQNFKTNVRGTGTFLIKGDTKLSVEEGILDIDANGNTTLDTNGTLFVTSDGAMDFVGSTIDLNKAARSAGTPTETDELVFLDSGTIESRIVAWEPTKKETAEVDYANEITAPKSAETLSTRTITELKEEDEFVQSDDVPITDADLKTAVASNKVVMTQFAEFSYNAHSGKINTVSASNKLTAEPALPSGGDTKDHSDDVVNVYEYTTSAGNTSASKQTAPVEYFDDEGNYKDGVNYSLSLSKHYNLGQLSKHAVVSSYDVVAQHGFTQQQIIDNLKTLAVNVLDPIKDKYPNMIVTSGFRSPAKGRSQHERGQAADMQFRGANKTEYYEIAQWIRENVPHDQLLLEYKDTGTGLPWIHVSVKDSGNRSEMATFFNHKTYKEYGTLYQIYA